MAAVVQIDVRLLSDPGGCAVGTASSPDREELVGKLAPPDTKMSLGTSKHVSEQTFVSTYLPTNSFSQNEFHILFCSLFKTLRHMCYIFY